MRSPVSNYRLLCFRHIILTYLLNTYPLKLERVENHVKILFFHHMGQAYRRQTSTVAMVTCIIIAVNFNSQLEVQCHYFAKLLALTLTFCFALLKLQKIFSDMTKFGLFQYTVPSGQWTGEAANMVRIEISMPLMFLMNVLNVCKISLVWLLSFLDGFKHNARPSYNYACKYWL